MRRTKEVLARALHNNLFIVLEVLCYKLDQSLLLLNQISSLNGSKTSMISKYLPKRKLNLPPAHSDLQRLFLTDSLNRIKYKLNLINSKHLLPRFFSKLQPFINNSSLSKLPLSNFLLQPRLPLSSTNNSSNHSRQPQFRSPNALSPLLSWRHLQ